MQEADEGADGEAAAPAAISMDATQAHAPPAPGTPADSREDLPVAVPSPDASLPAAAFLAKPCPDPTPCAPAVSVALRVMADSSVRLLLTPAGGPAAGAAAESAAVAIRAAAAPAGPGPAAEAVDSMDVERSGASGGAAAAGAAIESASEEEEEEEESEEEEEEEESSSSSAFTSSEEDDEPVTGPPTDAEAASLRAELAAMDEDGRDAQDAARRALRRLVSPERGLVFNSHRISMFLTHH